MVYQGRERTVHLGTVQRQQEGAGHGHGEDGAEHHEDGEPGEQGVGQEAGPRAPDHVDDDEDAGHGHHHDHEQLQPHGLAGQAQVLEEIFLVSGNFLVIEPANVVSIVMIIFFSLLTH